MACTELDEKAKKILEHLKRANKPLTLDEIVEGLKMERKAVVESMLPLVQGHNNCLHQRKRRKA